MIVFHHGALFTQQRAHSFIHSSTEIVTRHVILLLMLLLMMLLWLMLMLLLMPPFYLEFVGDTFECRLELAVLRVQRSHLDINPISERVKCASTHA